MPSPFPGMDPYLEAPDMWEDFHADLATKIRSQLTPHLRPRYVAVLTPQVTYDEVLIQETRLVKPDVGIVQVDDGAVGVEAVTIAPAPLTGRVALEVAIRSQSIEVRESDSGMLVTAIEILSPVNKRRGHDAYRNYLRKRRNLLRSEIHLLEIDLLRGGSRPPLETPLTDAPYFIFLSRSERRPAIEIWPLTLQDSIPTLPVPLFSPDADVPLDLGQAIQTVYDEAAYDLRIDYSQPPPAPGLTPSDASWLAEYLRNAGLR